MTTADATTVRTWARQNGFTTSDRGRLPGNVVQAYDAAHPTSPSARAVKTAKTSGAKSAPSQPSRSSRSKPAAVAAPSATGKGTEVAATKASIRPAAATQQPPDKPTKAKSPRSEGGTAKVGSAPAKTAATKVAAAGPDEPAASTGGEPALIDRVVALEKQLTAFTSRLVAVESSRAPDAATPAKRAGRFSRRS